jgi:hypothetical protein
MRSRNPVWVVCKDCTSPSITHNFTFQEKTMKSLKQLGMVAVLTLVLATSTFAGVISTVRTDPPPPPPATSSSEGVISTVRTETSTTTGQTSSTATSNYSAMEIVLNLLQTVLARL